MALIDYVDTTKLHREKLEIRVPARADKPTPEYTLTAADLVEITTAITAGFEHAEIAYPIKTLSLKVSLPPEGFSTFLVEILRAPQLQTLRFVFLTTIQLIVLTRLMENKDAPYLHSLTVIAEDTNASVDAMVNLIRTNTTLRALTCDLDDAKKNADGTLHRNYPMLTAALTTPTSRLEILALPETEDPFISVVKPDFLPPCITFSRFALNLSFSDHVLYNLTHVLAPLAYVTVPHPAIPGFTASGFVALPRHPRAPLFAGDSPIGHKPKYRPFAPAFQHGLVPRFIADPAEGKEDDDIACSRKKVCM